MFYEGELYDNLEVNRHNIIEYAYEKFSWERIGQKTLSVYKNLI